MPCHEIEVECEGRLLRPCCAKASANWAPFAGASAPSVGFEDRAGTAVVEGDIQIGSTQELRLRALAAEVPFFGERAVRGLARIYGAVVGSRKRIWPSKRIPFEFGGLGQWTKTNRCHVSDLIDLWNDRYGGIVRLTPKTATDYFNYVVLRVARISDSFVGMNPAGPQTLNLIPRVPPTEFLHEVCHAAGLYHEHSRNDRDDYIEIQWCQIFERQRIHFCPYFSNGREHARYDFDSIMHYPPLNSFGSSDTFRVTAFGMAHNGGVMPAFAPQGLSAGDEAALEALYSAG